LMFWNERPIASPAMKSRMVRAIVINANGMFCFLFWKVESLLRQVLSLGT
jgi:hypothetical protein